MGFPMPVKQHLYIESWHSLPYHPHTTFKSALARWRSRACCRASCISFCKAELEKSKVWSFQIDCVTLLGITLPLLSIFTTWIALKLYVLNFSTESYNIYHSSALTWQGWLESFLCKTRTCLFHSQYHGCWWPGDARSQSISSHGIDLIKPRLLDPAR